MRRVVSRTVTFLLFVLVSLSLLSMPWPPGTAPVWGQGKLASPSTGSCESAESCFHLALAAASPDHPGAVVPEQGSEAVAQLRLVVERYPDSPWAARAALVAGVLLHEQEPAQALELLRRAQQGLPLIEEYVRLWRAEALVRLGELSQAAAMFESIPRAVPDSLLRARVAYRGGQTWYEAGDCREAIVQLGRAVALDPMDPEAPRALLHLGDCQLREVETDAGQATLARVWVDYPETPEAELAVARLSARTEGGVWQPAPNLIYERARVLFGKAFYTQAGSAFAEFLRVAQDHPDREEARYLQGLVYVRLKQYEQAQRLYEALVWEKGPAAGKAAVWLAKTYVRRGEGTRLLGFLERLSELSLSSEQRATILLAGAVWLEDEGRLDQALNTYERAARAGAGTDVELKIHWQIGWLHYRSGRYEAAAEAFRRGADAAAEPDWLPQFLYWQGRALEQQSGGSGSAVHSQLCQKYPLSYYGKLASCPAPPGLEQSTGTEQADGAVGADAAPATVLREHLRYRKALELLTMRFKEEAARELTWLARQGFRERAVLLELSTRLSEAEAHHEALRLAKIYFRDYLEGTRQPALSHLWPVAYPLRYLPVIRAYAADLVDPYLVAAVIREESLYDVRALSAAGAVGLMQIMPATARTLTGGSEDVIAIREQLLNAETNIRLGSRYLGALLSRFSGNILHAVAAYNAGPSAVSSWVRRFGDKEPQEFVELIPYRETRAYVKRVLRTYREYHRLQNSGCPAPSLDKIC